MRFNKLMISLLLALTPAAMASTTWYVNGVSGSNGNDCKSPTTACKTIGHAISLAASGDSIMVGAATYTENLTIGINLTIVGSGAAKTIVDGGGVNTVFTISAEVSLSKLTVRGGNGRSGGGIYNSGALTINKGIISANTAYQDCRLGSCKVYGGGIYNYGALTINNSSVRGNTASIRCSNKCATVGGGIFNSGTLVINSSTVTGNSASFGCPPTGACYSSGGGIFNNYGTVTISKSTISGNSAEGAGGGIENSGGTLTMTNSTLSGNSAGFPYGNAYGGGIGNGGTLLINNSTISGNSASGNPGGYGGGVDVYAGVATLQNSIVADNTLGNNGSGANCYGTITSNGYNLSSDATCNFNGPGDLNNTDPQLGPLQHNGGPTKTMALPSGSPAIDAGNPKGCTDSMGNLLKTDQRGKPRPDPEDSGGCDIGAYESQSD